MSVPCYVTFFCVALFQWIPPKNNSPFALRRRIIFESHDSFTRTHFMSSGPRVPTGKCRFKVDGRLFSASLQSRRRWVASKNKPTRVPGAGGRAVVPSVAAGHLNCELDFVCPRETLSESATEGQRACGEVRREWTPIRTITTERSRPSVSTRHSADWKSVDRWPCCSCPNAVATSASARPFPTWDHPSTSDAHGNT